jgi:hypothetical protein
MYCNAVAVRILLPSLVWRHRLAFTRRPVRQHCYSGILQGWSTCQQRERRGWHRPGCTKSDLEVILPRSQNSSLAAPVDPYFQHRMSCHTCLLTPECGSACLSKSEADGREHWNSMQVVCRKASQVPLSRHYAAFAAVPAM